VAVKAFPVAPVPSPHGAVLETSVCLICGAPSSVIGAWVPGDPSVRSSRVRKEHLWPFGLCWVCFARPETVAAAEALIDQLISGGAN